MGFAAFGIARLHRSKDEAHFKSWLAKGFQGEMTWLSNYFDKRMDPRLVLDGSRTVLCFADSYLKPEHVPEIKTGRSPLVAKYAQGLDYHKALKDRIHYVAAQIKKFYPTIKYRIVADSAPLLEHYWAKEAGLGWVGKHSLIITKTAGSYVYLGEMLLDLELEPDEPIKAHCGTCRRCIEACPTEAIVSDYVLDANKCISYLSIEKDSPLSVQEVKQLEGHVLGCDICQDVCPWNHKDNLLTKFKGQSYEMPKEHALDFNNFEDLACGSENEFEAKWQGTAFNRLSFRKYQENVEAAKSHEKNKRSE